MEKLAYYLQIGTTTSSAVFAFVFLFYNWKKKLFKKLLALQFLILSFGLFISFLAFNDLFLLVPHLSRTGLLCALLIPPIQFLAIQRGLFSEQLKKADVFHFLPAIVYVINFFNYFLLTADEKIIVLQKHSIAEFNEGFLPAFILPALSILQTTFYLVWFVFLIKKIRKNIATDFLLKFIYFIMVYMVFHYIPATMAILFYYDDHNISSWLPVFYASANLFFFFKVLSTPEWLFYQNQFPKAPLPDKPTAIIEEVSPLETYLIATLSPNKTELSSAEKQLFQKFTEVIEAERLFLSPKFSQKTVADQLGISEYKVRLLLEKVYSLKFSEFANYRKTYFLLHEMRKNPQWQKYSFVAIARKLGYMSTNSFYLNFKKIAGATPKEFFNHTKS
jgi:AraC-like DNA-binding protein